MLLLCLAVVVAFAVTGPEQLPLLLLVSTLPLAVLLVPAGVCLVKAAGLLTLEVAYPAQPPVNTHDMDASPSLG